VEAGLLIGGPQNRQELEESIVRLRSGSLRVGVGTTVADEGLDIPRLTHVFLACPVHHHPKRMGQMIGRAARPFENKTQAVCVYFWDWKMFPTPKSGDSEEKLESKRAEFIRSLAKVVNTFSVSSTK
jgi:superfamily II DNA or RNA helicase